MTSRTPVVLHDGLPTGAGMVVRTPPDDPRWLPIASWVLGGAQSENGQGSPDLDAVVATARRGSLRLASAYWIAEENTIRGACLALISPGSCALVLPGPVRRNDAADVQACVACLRALRADLLAEGLAFLQALIKPADRDSATVLAEAGFVRLTRLLYFRRTKGDAPPCELTEQYEWMEFREDRADVFCEVLDVTYAQSLDCPELVNLRSPRAALAGHRAVGVFDPFLWWVLRYGQVPVGIMLLATLPDRNMLEVVYLGVHAGYRGRGLARALLSRAVREARNRGARGLTLAVDERNTTALRLYRRFGFVPTVSRDAWIATSPSA